MPVSRADRARISGIGARSFKAVVKELLTSGRKDVTIAVGTPHPITDAEDRKTLTRLAETEVRRMLVALNRGLPLPATQ
jgi:1-acyl-sn-glycerol-3-phosphate acyltransferase